MNAALRLAARMTYPGGSRARMNILMFHRVLDVQDPLAPSTPDRATFRRLMQWVARAFDVIPLSKAIADLDRGTLAPGSLSITFDDGYRDNLVIAAPILAELGLPATVFVASGFLERPMMWNDCIIEGLRCWEAATLDVDDLGLGRHATGTAQDKVACIGHLLPALKHRHVDERDALVAALSKRVGFTPKPGLMLAPDDLPRICEHGIEIGAHTVNHPILSCLQPHEAQREIADGKAALEAIVQRPVTLFAYPNGRPGDDYEPIHVEQVKRCGFDAAFTTVAGVASPQAERFEIPRFTPWDHTPGRFVLKLLAHGLRPGSVS